MKSLRYGVLLLATLMLASCGSYKQSIMFRVPKGYSVPLQVQEAEKNYTIAKNDLLKLEVYTNKGERLIDPDLETAKESGGQAMTAHQTNDYLVDAAGKVKFPMVGEIVVESLTIRQAEEILQKEYAVYYQQPFVVLKFVNKRVTLLGAQGGYLIPLTNENIRLTEVLAMGKGIPRDGRAKSIRLLRGDQVFLLDLSTIEGYQKNNLIVQPNDIIYIEPAIRPFSEGLREYGSLFSIVTSLTTLIIVFSKL